MTHSEQINEIGGALAKAQKRIEGAAKAAENPGFKRGNQAAKYADLAAIWDACREPLADNGIAVIQAPQTDGAKVTVETLLVHSSGQWFRDELSAQAAAAAPQAIGSAITYLRRYALASMVGVAPADDDGEAAEGRDTHAGRPSAPPQTRAESVKAKVAAQTQGPKVPEDAAGRRADLIARMSSMGYVGATMAAQLGEWIGRPVDKSTVLTAEDWSRADASIKQTQESGERIAKARENAERAGDILGH